MTAVIVAASPVVHAPRHVFRWDLDKTYLRTEFDSMRGLVKAAIETAADKQAYPGATALLRALRAGDGHRVCIISGSPTQMRTVLAAKLALDGVEYDEFVLKNNLKNLLRGRFRAVRAQIPYKLPALLESRAGARPAPAETLFGDDAEADAIIYCLYDDILAGRVPLQDLERILEAARAYPDELIRTLDAAQRAPKGEVVRRVIIHLDRRSPPNGFRRFGPRLVPVFNYFQAALVLYQDAVLALDEPTLVELSEYLADADPGVRRTAVATLVENLPDGYCPALLAALDDEDREVRLQAADSVRELVEVLPDPEAIAVQLNSDDPVVRAAAVYVLSSRRAGSAADYRRAVTDGDQRVRIEAVRALVSVDDVEGVAAAATDDSREVRIAVANALATLAAGGDTVRALLADRDPLVRAAALAALGVLGDADADVPVIERALTEPAWQIRVGAARALSGVAAPLAVPTLSRALTDTHLDVRKAAVLSLTRWAGSETAAREALGLALKDVDADVRA